MGRPQTKEGKKVLLGGLDPKHPQTLKPTAALYGTLINPVKDPLYEGPRGT